MRDTLEMNDAAWRSLEEEANASITALQAERDLHLREAGAHFAKSCELAARAEASEAREADISAAIGSVRFMDPPDGGDVSPAEQVRRMREALESSEAAFVALVEDLDQAMRGHPGADQWWSDCGTIKTKLLSLMGERP